MDYKTYYTNLLKPYTDKLLCSREIAELTGLKQKHVQKLLKKYDLPRQKQGDAGKGSRNHFWRGGRIVDADGYILIKKNDHPFGTSNGYVREHRLVMESKLDRYLMPEEVVHHINGVNDDNRPENLELFESNAQHLKAELTGKIPKWSLEGKERILKAVRLPRAKKAPSNPI